jgi:hypothetical protein
MNVEQRQVQQAVLLPVVNKICAENFNGLQRVKLEKIYENVYCAITV